MARKSTQQPTHNPRSLMQMRMAGGVYTYEFFDLVLLNTRMYFRDAYEGGTREMIRRYVNKKLDGYVPPQMITACLKILKYEGGILFEAKVWWDVNAV